MNITKIILLTLVFFLLTNALTLNVKGQDKLEIKVQLVASYLDTKSVVFSHDGKFALSANREEETLTLWQIPSGIEIRTFSGHSGDVNSVAFSPDDKYALSGSKDKTLKIWNIASGMGIKTFIGHTGSVESVAFSPDGKYALCGLESRSPTYNLRDRALKLYDLGSGKEIVQMTGFIDGEWVMITPDGYFNASPNEAKYINVIQGMNVYSIDKFYSTYYRPDIVSARIKGKDTRSIEK